MFLINIWTIVLALFGTYIYIYLKKKFSYFSDRGIVYVCPSILKFFKSLSLTSLSQAPIDIYNDQSSYSNPYIGYFSLTKPGLVILDPGLAESILIKEFSHFHDHGFDIDTESNPLNGHLFNMKGDKWRTLRHKLLPTFTSGKLKGMIPVMEECADNLIKDMEKEHDLLKDTNLKELFRRYSLDVIARCAFGIDPEGVKNPDSEFRRIMKRLMNPSIYTMIKFGVVIAIPILTKIFKVKLFPRDMEEFFYNFTRESFEARKKSGIKTNDFIQLLLELKEKGEVVVNIKELEEDERDSIELIKSQPPPVKLEFTDELLIAQVFVFLIAGYENTAYLVAITMYALSKHPEIQERVREEVREIRNKHGSMDYQAVRDMKLLQASIDEALRLYAPIPTLLRECTKNFTLNDGTFIEKGMTVVLPAKGFHLDSRYWCNPEVFNPDRFLGDQEIKPGTYMPFGDGPRICIAQRMALIVAKLMVAKTLMKFKALPSRKTKEPLKISNNGSADAEGGIWGSFSNI